MAHRKLDYLLSKRFSGYANTVHPVAAGAAIVIGVLAISALINRLAAKRAERDNPPLGKFLEVRGLRLHYVEYGTGEPLVLLHGNAGMIEDFASSGLIGLACTIWTHESQAHLIHDALSQMGIQRATVLGHSWGEKAREV
jgi:hypothetical protein